MNPQPSTPLEAGQALRQLGLPFAPTLEQQFNTWAATPGGGHILMLLYRRAAWYAARYRRTGRRVSVRLLWEQVRDHVTHYAPKLRRRLPAKIEGYRLNDHLHAYAARHIIAHRPEWAGLFELREVGRPKPVKRVIVIEEPLAPHRRAA